MIKATETFRTVSKIVEDTERLSLFLSECLEATARITGPLEPPDEKPGEEHDGLIGALGIKVQVALIKAERLASQIHEIESRLQG